MSLNRFYEEQIASIEEQRAMLNKLFHELKADLETDIKRIEERIKILASEFSTTDRALASMIDDPKPLSPGGLENTNTKGEGA